MKVNVHFEPELTLRQLRHRLHLIHPRWPSYPNGVGIILGDFSICDPQEGRFQIWNQTFTDGEPRKTATFHSFFPHVLDIAQPDCSRRDSTALGIIRTLSRIDRIFINLHMAEARDFHCSSPVFENLVNRTIPSDHAAVRLVIHKPTNWEQQCKRIPNWMSKHPVFCTLLQRLHDDICFSTDPFGALAEFKVLLEKAKRLTIRELSRKTPDSSGAKLLIACTSLRAYRKRHLGTLMPCCEAWKPIEDCFDPISFECVDFQRLSQIIANFTRENLAEREAEITNLPWTQTEKDTALARCRGGQRAWRNKKTVLTLSAVTDEEGHPLENEDDSGTRLCEYWGTIFQARVEGPTNHQHEDVLRYVQQAPDDICWTNKAEFDDLLALKKDSAPGPDGIPYGAYRCAGGWARNSSLMLTKLLWKEVLFLIMLLRVELFLSPRLLTSMTMEGSFDHQTHFVH